MDCFYLGANCLEFATIWRENLLGQLDRAVLQDTFPFKFIEAATVLERAG